MNSNAPTKDEIAGRLRAMADDLDALALSMEYYGGCAPWARHAKEMMGAAVLCRDWAREIAAGGGWQYGQGPAGG